MEQVRQLKLENERQLESLVHLQLDGVDTTLEACACIGSLVPQLQSMHLTGLVACIRDLGTKFQYLTWLCLAGTQLGDLDGIPSFQVLEHLDVSGNLLTCLSPLAFMDVLVTLRVGDNQITDPEQLFELSGVTTLRKLWCKGNPCAAANWSGEAVRKMLPQVLAVDSEDEVFPDAATAVRGRPPQENPVKQAVKKLDQDRPPDPSPHEQDPPELLPSPPRGPPPPPGDHSSMPRSRSIRRASATASVSPRSSTVFGGTVLSPPQSCPSSTNSSASSITRLPPLTATFEPFPTADPVELPIAPPPLSPVRPGSSLARAAILPRIGTPSPPHPPPMNGGTRPNQRTPPVATASNRFPGNSPRAPRSAAAVAAAIASAAEGKGKAVSAAMVALPAAPREVGGGVRTIPGPRGSQS
ncbi:hypothetical protein BC828DRAFT_391421 [Blastocladiella britannica]|nr:hypothetical protein BC828DRAFT_391421 [Blastocladiella britannica]